MQPIPHEPKPTQPKAIKRKRTTPDRRMSEIEIERTDPIPALREYLLAGIDPASR